MLITTVAQALARVQLSHSSFSAFVEDTWFENIHAAGKKISPSSISENLGTFYRVR